jgi:hypothetical protein
MRYPLNYMVNIVGYAYKRLNVISRQYDCISIYGLPVELHGQHRRLCTQEAERDISSIRLHFHLCVTR